MKDFKIQYISPKNELKFDFIMRPPCKDGLVEVEMSEDDDELYHYLEKQEIKSLIDWLYKALIKIDLQEACLEEKKSWKSLSTKKLW